MMPCGWGGMRLPWRMTGWAAAVAQTASATARASRVRIMGARGRGLVFAEVELLGLAVQRVREELLVAARTQVVLQLLVRGGRLQVGVVAVAQELPDGLQLVVAQVGVGELGGVG